MSDRRRNEKEEETANVTAQEQKEKEPQKLTYQFTPDSIHYLVIVVKKSVNLNQLKFNVINFVVDNYNFDDYAITDEDFSNNFHLILVKGIKDAEKAKEFYSTFIRDTSVFKDFKSADYQYFVISSGNLELFRTDKSVIDYMKFFDENYLK